MISQGPENAGPWALHFSHTARISEWGLGIYVIFAFLNILKNDAICLILCQPSVPYTDMETQLDNEYGQLKSLQW